jgi:hypothetical protein
MNEQLFHSFKCDKTSQLNNSDESIIKVFTISATNYLPSLLKIGHGTLNYTIRVCGYVYAHATYMPPFPHTHIRGLEL